MTNHPHIKAFHFYGRRQGRRIRSKGAILMESVLPPLLLDPGGLSSTKNLTAFFPSCVKDVWCEIGFGGGEHLAHQLVQNPTIGILGCEPFKNGIARLLGILPPECRPRVRIFPEDIRLLLPFLPGGSFSRFYILFPDPWPKKRHHKRRLVSQPLLDQIARLLKKGGEVRLASDATSYVAEMYSLLTAHSHFKWAGGITGIDPNAWPNWPSSWFLTRYGQKAKSEGRPSAHLIFSKIF